MSDSIIVLQVIYYRRRRPEYRALDDECEEIPPESYGSIATLRGDEATMYETLKFEIKQKRVLLRIASFWIATATFISISIILVIWSLWPTGSPSDVDLSQLKLVPQLLGWTSASFYVFSRIPQILKTYRDETVEGLSIGMFVFSVIGNITFAAVSSVPSFSCVFGLTEPDLVNYICYIINAKILIIKMLPSVSP